MASIYDIGGQSYRRLPGTSQRFVNIATGKEYSRRAFEEKLQGKGKKFFERKAEANYAQHPILSKARPAKGRKSTVKSNKKQNPSIVNKLSAELIAGKINRIDIDTIGETIGSFSSSFNSYTQPYLNDIFEMDVLRSINILQVNVNITPSSQNNTIHEFTLLSFSMPHRHNISVAEQLMLISTQISLALASLAQRYGADSELHSVDLVPSYSINNASINDLVSAGQIKSAPATRRASNTEAIKSIKQAEKRAKAELKGVRVGSLKNFIVE